MPSMRPRAINVLFGVAATVIIIAGLKAAAAIVVPFLLAVFLVILIAPIYFWLQRKGAPSWAALIVLILGMLGIGLFGATFFTNAINDFAGNLSKYQRELTLQINDSVKWLESHGVEIEEDWVAKTFDVRSLFTQTANLLKSIGGILSNAFVIILIAIFILMEAARLPDKIRHLPGMTDNRWQDLERIVDNVRHYMGMKTVMSAMTGVLVTTLLILMGVDYPILLGVLAFLLNFVPSIGSIIAAVPGILLAIVLHGMGDAMIVAAGYLIINVGISNVLEPRYMGKGLGLSPMIIIVTLFLWAWMLGPVGMLLSVPLTMAIKVALEASANTRGIAYLMSDTVPTKDTETSE
ncbi:AI-2E family transporter [Cerasicoccus arenae]|uniref:Membrane protein n=1 Tax=Cerasicoccus arenae TaxID=424488 RepID=A0A8J3DDB9_9BACT|nr:AI-2E family transporter [Cerasicoccus arenae]MBK1857384.1 AI-2E family transporter [Cerasicoccus arenae]GHC09158.1 membrane protein [Cerasicoccus arenae]